jgi:glutathionyl-hydroquinone reductase
MAEARQPFVIRSAEERDGAFVRQASRFWEWVTADGSSGFAPATGRYLTVCSLRSARGDANNASRELSLFE